MYQCNRLEHMPKMVTANRPAAAVAIPPASLILATGDNTGTTHASNNRHQHVDVLYPALTPVRQCKLPHHLM